ncbi:hypothetical protein [Pseudoduganella sp. R-43]|uniref:hypothetical protein n=1 Tax=unclassified Pseudoduganella TaxID=2637179 RepID=UPI003CF2270A
MSETLIEYHIWLQLLIDLCIAIKKRMESDGRPELHSRFTKADAARREVMGRIVEAETQGLSLAPPSPAVIDGTKRVADAARGKNLQLETTSALMKLSTDLLNLVSVGTGKPGLAAG